MNCSYTLMDKSSSRELIGAIIFSTQISLFLDHHFSNLSLMLNQLFHLVEVKEADILP